MIPLPIQLSAGARFPNTPGSGVRPFALTAGLLPYFRQGASIGNLSASFPEPSGLARPTLAANAAYLWFEQDSGGPNTIVALNASTAAAAGSWTLQGVTQNDCEDLTSARVNGVSYIYFCDVGNNGNAADSRGVGIDVSIYRCIEPTITGSDGTILAGNILRIDCAYPAGNPPALRDCECAFADPSTGDLYLVTKRIFPALIYRLPFAASYTGTQTLQYVGKLACDTSATSTTIGTGAKTFATVSSLAFPIGCKVRIASRASAANFMEGQVTAQSAGSLSVLIEAGGTIAGTGGAGTFADWDITLANTYTRSANNGCVTGGTMAPSGREIVLVSYAGTMLWTRSTSDTIGTALARAPIAITGDVPGGIYYSHNTPAFPQREAIEFGYSGRDLYSVSEFIGTEGTINPVIKYARLNRRATTVRLQQGLNSYAGCTDTYLGSAAPSTDNGAISPIVADIDFAVATTFSAVASVGGTMIDLTVPASTTFVVGLGARVSGSSVASYNGTWAVDSKPSGTVVRLRCAFNGTASGSIQAHTQDRQILLKFDLSSIPAGATIVDAKLRLYISNEGKGFWVNQMLTTWASSSTFTSRGLIVTNGTDATATPDVSVEPSALDTYAGWFTFSVPLARIQGWLNNAATNKGWAILGHPDDLTGDGFQMESAESATQEQRPMLIVSYTQ